MTIGDWLAGRAPAAPPILERRLRQLLEPALEDDAAHAPERCLQAAEATVSDLLRAGRVGRESATDLLAADALVTYAFEAAASDPSTIVDRARAAMLRLAQIASIDVGAPAVNDRSFRE